MISVAIVCGHSDLAVGEALAGLAERGITARTYFDAGEGLLIVWMMRPGEEPGGGDNHG